MIDIACSRCGRVYHADESHLGRSLKCVQCGELIHLAISKPSGRITPNQQMRPATKPVHYCPKCGSEEIIDYSYLEANSPNPQPMFCVDCQAIGTEQAFSQKPHLWNWRYWRIKLIPLIIAVTVSRFLPFQMTWRVVSGTALYIFLFCITWRRADGTKPLPPYLW
jgi:DNA-directed RNA polymerase subunit M/transcription elongation factor TFIIS